nr:hypothetical protein [uncultured Roseateles sp.]
MGFAKVAYELEMESGVESFQERVIEPERASVLPFALPPDSDPELVMKEGLASVDTLDDVPGLASLVQVLRNPEALFGESSERRPEPCGKPVDWTSAPGEIHRYLTYWGMSCADVLARLTLASEVLREHGIKICRGEPIINFIWPEDTMSIQIILCIDAPSKHAHDLTCELSDRAIDLGLLCRAFTFSFMDGEGEDDSEDELDVRIRLARAKTAKP